MNRGDLPSISSGAYGGSTVMNLAAFGDAVATESNLVTKDWNDAVTRRMVAVTADRKFYDQFPAMKHEERTTMAAKRRFVQVFVVDPNDAVPLNNSVLYQGDSKLTDSTDQELFFELDMKNILERHNEMRVKVVDKKVKDRTEYLEPAKIRDLKMVVVNIAEF